jgi:hypothetical protein
MGDVSPHPPPPEREFTLLCRSPWAAPQGLAILRATLPSALIAHEQAIPLVRSKH